MEAKSSLPETFVAALVTKDNDLDLVKHRQEADRIQEPVVSSMQKKIATVMKVEPSSEKQIESHHLAQKSSDSLKLTQQNADGTNEQTDDQV